MPIDTISAMKETIAVYEAMMDKIIAEPKLTKEIAQHIVDALQEEKAIAEKYGCTYKKDN